MPNLTYRGVELRRSDDSIFFWISRGFDDEAEVRGEDTVYPRRSGLVEGSRVKSRRIIELSGWVLGSGADETAARAAYRAAIDELHAIFDPTLSPGALVVYAPVMGLASGSKSINARYLGAVWNEWIAGLKRSVVVQLECIASPPEWT